MRASVAAFVSLTGVVMLKALARAGKLVEVAWNGELRGEIDPYRGVDGRSKLIVGYTVDRISTNVCGLLLRSDVCVIR